MQIRTKFDPKQKVFYLKGTKLIENEIHSIDINIKRGKNAFAISETIWFRNEINGTPNYVGIDEEKVFTTKEEFMTQLTEKQ